MKAQFYKVEYTIARTGPMKGFRLHQSYEKGREKLFKLIGECLADSGLGSITIERIEENQVPRYILKELN